MTRFRMKHQKSLLPKYNFDCKPFLFTIHAGDSIFICTISNMVLNITYSLACHLSAQTRSL